MQTTPERTHQVSFKSVTGGANGGTLSAQLLKCCIHFNDETSVGLVSLLLQTELNLLKRLYQLCEDRNPLVAACSSCGLLSCLPLLDINGLEPANCRFWVSGPFIRSLMKQTALLFRGVTGPYQPQVLSPCAFISCLHYNQLTVAGCLSPLHETAWGTPSISSFRCSILIVLYCIKYYTVLLYYISICTLLILLIPVEKKSPVLLIFLKTKFTSDEFLVITTNHQLDWSDVLK